MAWMSGDRLTWMRVLMSVSSFFFLLCCALSIQISGPAQVATPQPVTLTVTGLPELNDKHGLIEQITTVLSTNRFIISAPDDAIPQIRRRLFIEEISGVPGWMLELTLTIEKPGVYVIIGPDYTHHRLVVGGTSPQPDPIVTEAKAAILLIESKTQDIDQSILTNKLRTDPELSNKILFFDPDQKLANGQPDPQVQELLTHGSPPRFYVLDDENDIITHFPLPKTWAEARSKLLEAGLKPQ